MSVELHLQQGMFLKLPFLHTSLLLFDHHFQLMCYESTDLCITRGDLDKMINRLTCSRCCLIFMSSLVFVLVGLMHVLLVCVILYMFLFAVFQIPSQFST